MLCTVFGTLTSMSVEETGLSWELWVQALSPFLLLLATLSLSFSMINFVVTKVSRLEDYIRFLFCSHGYECFNIVRGSWSTSLQAFEATLECGATGEANSIANRNEFIWFEKIFNARYFSLTLTRGCFSILFIANSLNIKDQDITLSDIWGKSYFLRCKEFINFLYKCVYRYWTPWIDSIKRSGFQDKL